MVDFCGIVSFDGDSCRDISLMIQSFPVEIGNDFVLWGDQYVMFGQRSTKIYPEQDNPDLPFFDTEHDLAIMGDIRLDDRDGLCAALNIPHVLRSQVGDYRLILSAYQKWGESFPSHLLGDFAIILWDSKQQRLICCSDHFGFRSLFYYFDGRKFIFASSPGVITAMRGVPESVNYNKLSTLIFPEAKHLFFEESWFNNILLVQAATTIAVNRSGLTKHKYWEPETVKEQSFKNDNEFSEAFYDVISKSVGDRLRGKTTATALLSGGLDSSAIVSVAAKILEKQNKQLQVFSAVLPPGDNGAMIDERYFIDQFRSFPNIVINYVTAPEKGFFSDLGPLENIIHSPNLMSRHYLYTAFVEGAQALGSNVILDGLGGEFGATFYGTGAYAEFFLKMRWGRLWHELKSRKALSGSSIIADMKNQVIRPLLPGKIIDALRGRNVGLNKAREHCIQPEFTEMLKARLTTESLRMKSFSRDVSPFHRQNQLNMVRLKQNKAQGTANLGTVEARYPLMDKRLLEFCLSVPADLKVRNGYERYTVRAGLKNILPPEIQWRTSKVPFSPDYNRRYNNQIPQVKAFLMGISPTDPIRKVVDVEKLKTLTDLPLRDEEFNTFAEKAARDFVPQGIYLIRFLRRFKEFRS